MHEPEAGRPGAYDRSRRLVFLSHQVFSAAGGRRYTFALSRRWACSLRMFWSPLRAPGRPGTLLRYLAGGLVAYRVS